MTLGSPYTVVAKQDVVPDLCPSSRLVAILSYVEGDGAAFNLAPELFSNQGQLNVLGSNPSSGTLNCIYWVQW